MRVLVTGSNGLLGQKLAAYAPDTAEVFGLDLQQTNLATVIRYETVDLGDKTAVQEIVRREHPQWIINAAAYTDVDGAEKNREVCRRVNVSAVENLASACAQNSVKLVHLSTDYIFDGHNGPYGEDDPPHPIGWYGETKLAGEKVLQHAAIDYAIVRTMVLYGVGRQVRPNFVTWLVDKLRKREPVRIVTDQFGNTTLADELAEGIWKLMAADGRGVYHMAGSEIVDRYSFAMKIAEIFELDNQLIQAITTAQLQQQAPRPMKSGLLVEKAMRDLGVRLSNVEDGLRRCRTQWAGPE